MERMVELLMTEHDLDAIFAYLVWKLKRNMILSLLN